MLFRSVVRKRGKLETGVEREKQREQGNHREREGETQRVREGEKVCGGKLRTRPK